MAQRRWTLALIIICLPILATLITAFRVRDLPKSAHDSVKKPQKCDDCEVKVGQKFKSVKIESEKHSFEDSKKAVREKEQVIIKKPDIPLTHKFEPKSDQKKDDEHLDVLKSRTGFRQEIPLSSKAEKFIIKQEAAAKKPWASHDDYDSEFDVKRDDDEDADYEAGDYDDDEIQIPEVLRKAKEFKITIPKLETPPQTPEIKKPEPKSTSKDQKDVEDNKKVKLDATESKINIPETKKKTDEPLKKSAFKIEINDDDDDDEDDDEDDDKIKTKLDKKKKTEDIKIKKMDSGVKIETKPVLSSLETRINDMLKAIPYFNDDDDEDDDDDYEDDDDEISKKKDKSLERQSKFPGKIAKEDAKSKDSSREITGKRTLTSKHKKLESKERDSAEDEKSKPNIKNKGLTSGPTESKVKISIQTSSKEMKKIFKDFDDYEDEEDDDEGEIKAPKPPPKVLVKKPIERHERKDTKLEKKIEPKSKETEVKKSDTLKKDIKDELKTAKLDKAKTDSTESRKADKKESKAADEKLNKEIHKQNETEKDKTEVKKDKQTDTFVPKIKDDKVKDTFKITETKRTSKIEFDSKWGGKDHRRDKTSKEKPFDSQEAFTSSESHLKTVTDALHRRNLLKSEFEDFYAFFPTFAPNFSRIHNPECRRHGQIVLRQLRGTKLWALNLLDATAKIPSGLLQGNGIQLGDFDQCLGSRARVQLDTGSVVKVQGKYCLARIDVKAEHPELETPVHLAQAKNLIRSKIDDPGHFVPRFSTLSWGVCVPTACNHEDVEFILRDAIRHYQKTSGVAVRIKVDEDDCHVEKRADWWKDWLETPTILTLSFYGVIILLVAVATIQDFVAQRSTDDGQNGAESNENAECDQNETEDGRDKQKTLDSVISPFSLYRTLKKLVAPGTTDEIACIHGIRGIATLALLVAHKFLPVAAIPYSNRVYLTETVSSPVWSWCRAGWVFTDCFLLLSGALTAHRISKDSDTIAPKRLLSRYVRLTPALLAVVLFYAYVWDYISIGPMWGSLVTKNAEVCQEGWWWNLLYVQNYFGLEEMCAPQTHQLALDMQLTILGGMIVWAMQVKQGFFRLLIPGLHAVAAYSRYTTVRDHRLTLLAYHGVSVSQLYRTARLSYTSTLHRSTPYLVGLSLGLALTKPARHGKIFLTFGWLVSGVLWGLVWWAGIDSGSTQYRYTTSFAAQYAALAPIASAVAIAWIIYAVNNGTCDFLSRLLCCRPLVLISRLSYALYLCQFVVFITNAATVKTSSEFTLMSLIDVQEISMILLSSIVLTVTLVIPMQSLYKAITFSTKSDASESPDESKNGNGKAKPLNEIDKPKEKEMPQIRQRQHLLVHREVLQEISESEVEFEAQREKNEGLEEILEEEENGEEMEEEGQMQDDDLEIIEEEEGGEDSWPGRVYDGRSYSREDDRDLDEWEWTANGRNGAQLYRYSR